MFCNSNMLSRVSRSFYGIRSFMTTVQKLAAEESIDGNLPGSNYTEKSEHLLVYTVSLIDFQLIISNIYMYI